MIFALAWRNLWRHPRRTLLNLLAITFASIITIFMLSLQVGTYSGMIERTLGIFDGDVQIQKPDYLDNPRIRLTINNPHVLQDEIKIVPNVEHVSVRALSYAMLSSDNHSYGAQIVGVEPKNESLVSTLPHSIRQGHYLLSNDSAEIVLGETLANNLHVNVGDNITLLGMAKDGSVAVDSLTVAGIFRSGVKELDRQLAEMPLNRFQTTFAMPHEAHTIVITTRNLSSLNTLLPRLTTLVNHYHLAVRDWSALQPGLKQAIELDAGTSMLFYAALIIVVVFSILNTLLMSVMERTREFGVLLALSMRPVLIGRVVWLETLILLTLSILASLAAGYGLTEYFVIHGIHLQSAEALFAQWGLPGALRPEITMFSMYILKYKRMNQ